MIRQQADLGALDQLFPRTRKIALMMKFLKFVAVGLILLVLLTVGACSLFLDKPRPTLSDASGADEMARAMMAATHHDAWLQTGAVQWDFGGRQQHLWDRNRGYAQVDWGENRVQLDLATRTGVAWVSGEQVEGDAAAELLEKAWAFWCNDSFWLNPIAKAFDEGTTRAIVETDEGRALWVGYESGGVTPGDGYLWHFEDNGNGEDTTSSENGGDVGLPTSWQMWTQILPMGGVRAGWEDWITLETGAKIATRHPTSLFELVLSDVSGAADVEQLTGGTDPFGPLETYLHMK